MIFNVENEDYAPAYPEPEAKFFHHRLDDTIIGIIIGALTAFILLIIFISFVVVYQYRRFKLSSGNDATKHMFTIDHVNFGTTDLHLSNGKYANGMMYSVMSDKVRAVDKSEVDSIQELPVAMTTKSVVAPSAKLGSSDPESSGMNVDIVLILCI